ncbi:MAG TPA: carboxylating nicotinate-nucleotide diphosphorylase [Candidatus Kryptobacter bacterium]|nr:carboxylating nicotinate-nucleotide diphosphorylase [Candidatus Kryptobacter bacterium]
MVDYIINEIIRRALAEDIGGGDVTTNSIVSPDSEVSGRFIAKSAGVVAGWDVVRATFRLVDERVKLFQSVSDGTEVKGGESIGKITGPGRAILSGERVALNFLQRMSGIATATRRFVEAAAGTRAVILDTRKTAPGLRVLDKLAVRIGGASNHRTGLYDMVLIKDNHIAEAGRITEAVRRVKKSHAANLKMEVEVRTLDELREAVELGVDRILLDNMSIPEMRRAVKIVRGRVPLEASGNMNIRRITAVAATGVDFISVGALTHSVIAMDISLMIEKK